jgi:ABC-type transport system involved in multi-copper enzyme maturation permease subunit
MTALLRAELLKLRTTRTFAALAGAAVALSVLIAGLVAMLTEPTKESVLVDVFTSDTSSFFILILAVVGISGEWRHHTITSSLLAAPDRRRFVAAKAVAFATAGLALSLLISAAVIVVGSTVLLIRDLPLPELGDLIAQLGRNALVAAVLGAFGVAIGALVRNQIVAVVGLLALSFAIEPLVIGLAPTVGRFLQLGALPVAVSGIPPDEAGMGDIELLGALSALLMLALWIGVAFSAAATLLRRRDLE